MKTPRYEEAFDRIRAEYVEMPGMRLTPAQVERLSGIESAVCQVVLDDLVRAKFLRVEEDGTYVRCMGEGRSGLRMARHELNAGRGRNAG